MVWVHTLKTCLDLLLDKWIDLPRLFRRRNIIGPFVFGIGGANQVAPLLQLVHRLGNDTFIQRQPLGDIILGQGPIIADNQDYYGLRRRKIIRCTVVIQPDMGLSIQNGNRLKWPSAT